MIPVTSGYNVGGDGGELSEVRNKNGLTGTLSPGGLAAGNELTESLEGTSGRNKAYFVFKSPSDSRVLGYSREGDRSDTWGEGMRNLSAQGLRG